MLRAKQTHTYIYFKFIQHHYTHNTPARQIHHRYQYINSKYTSPFFLNFTYCMKDTNLQGILRIYEARPIIVPNEFLQPVEIPILEFIHNTRYNHKLYNLVQNTPYELSPSTEEHNIIKALELLWPLLQSKNIIRLIAKFLTSSEIIHYVFPQGFFTNE